MEGSTSFLYLGTFSLLWYADPSLGNDSEINNYIKLLVINGYANKQVSTVTRGYNNNIMQYFLRGPC
jgi:hypothetical protein